MPIKNKLTTLLLGQSTQQLASIAKTIRNIETNIISKISEKISDKEANIVDKFEAKESNIIDKIEEKENNIIEKIAEKENSDQVESPYLQAVMKKLEKKVNDTNKQVRNQIRRAEVNTTQEAKDKVTRIVLKPKAVNIRNSKDLRKQFNEHHPNVLLCHARISAGGSYVLQFESEEEANKVTDEWDVSHFSGNSGLVKPTGVLLP